MSTDASLMDQQTNEQDSPRKSPLKLPKILGSSPSPINFDTTLEDLNKFTKNVQK